MNVQQYLQSREAYRLSLPHFRDVCPSCFMPRIVCYCAHVRRFDAKIKFVILIHPLEIRRKIATGRMSHLSLKDSELLRGQDFTACARLNDLLASREFEPVVLFPGANSLNLSAVSSAERAKVFADSSRQPMIIVADGTWNTAKKTVRRSQNLVHLPRICFSPTTASQFRVRKQPHPECVSTIEAIHQTLELLGPNVGFDISSRAHDSLLNVFNKMVENQLHFIADSRQQPSRYARARSAL